MKRIAILISVAIAMAGCMSRKEAPGSIQQSGSDLHSKASHSHGGHDDHGPQGKLMVDTEPPQVQAGQPVTLHMMVHAADGTMVRDFETVHEKKLHLIIVRAGLDHFAHVHPDLDAAGNVTIRHTFPVGGTYWLYADHKPLGKEETTAVAEIRVAGDAPPTPPLTPNVPGDVTGDGLGAHVDVSNPKAGSATPITFQVKDPTGKPVTDLQPYLGAMGHLVVLSADGKEYVHAHPADGPAQAPDGLVAFDAHFSKAGTYKAWGQFQRAGQVYTVPVVLVVK